MIILHQHAHSSYSRKVRIVLEEKKIPYDIVSVSLETGQNKKDDFLKLNAWGKVPVLTDGNLTLPESGAINEYLEERYPEPALLPSTVEGRAQIRALERLQDHHLGPQLGILFTQYFFTKPGLRDEKLVARSFKEIQDYLCWADRLLKDREFFGGDLFSLADVAHVHPFLNQLMPFNIDSSRYPNVTAWMERVKTRPSVASTDPGTYRIPQAARKISA